METSFGALSDEPGMVLTEPPAAPVDGSPTPNVTWLKALAAGRPEAGRYADMGRLPRHGPGQPGIAAAASSNLFASGANITQSQPCSAGPFGGTFFVRAEFYLDALGGRSGAVRR